MPRRRWRSRLSGLLRRVADRLDPERRVAGEAADVPDFWAARARGGRPVGTGTPRPAPPRFPPPEPGPAPAVAAEPAIGTAPAPGAAPARPRATIRATGPELGRPEDPQGGVAFPSAAKPPTTRRVDPRGFPPDPEPGAGSRQPSPTSAPAPVRGHRSAEPPYPTAAVPAPPSVVAPPVTVPRPAPLDDLPGPTFPVARQPRPIPGVTGSFGTTAPPHRPDDNGGRDVEVAAPGGPAERRTPRLSRPAPAVRPAPTTPAGGSRLVLRPPSAGEHPVLPAARPRTGDPVPDEPVPSADLWPDLPVRPPAPPEPAPVTAQLTRWQRLTAEQAAT